MSTVNVIFAAIGYGMVAYFITGFLVWLIDAVIEVMDDCEERDRVLTSLRETVPTINLKVADLMNRAELFQTLLDSHDEEFVGAARRHGEEHKWMCAKLERLEKHTRSYDQPIFELRRAVGNLQTYDSHKDAEIVALKSQIGVLAANDKDTAKKVSGLQDCDSVQDNLILALFNRVESLEAAHELASRNRKK